MKQFEMRYQVSDYSMTPQIEIIQANSLQEATIIIESKVKMLGKGINWLGKRQIS